MYDAVSTVKYNGTSLRISASHCGPGPGPDAANRANPEEMRVLELFSGIGGMHAAMMEAEVKVDEVRRSS